MDLVHDRASIIAEEDRISNLPIEIIHHILSFIDLKYAAQTSKLSRKWKHIWTSMPYLNLHCYTFRTMPQFARFVKHALSRRNDCTEVSAAELTLKGAATQFVVKSLIRYAYSHNVRQLTIRWSTYKALEFPQYIFSSHTLKHLTLATPSLLEWFDTCYVPKSAWDFPVLETLTLSNIRFGESSDKSLNLFSKCVNLKDLTLHRFTMVGLDVFDVCAPKLTNLTLTDPNVFPNVFNVVAPQLENLTAAVGPAYRTIRSFTALQLSTEGLNSLEKVKLFLPTPGYEKERYVAPLLNLFQKLRSAKFLILDVDVIEYLSSCLDQLSLEPCPFNNLKCLKIDTTSLVKLYPWQEDRIFTMPTQVRNYLLESSPSATFIMDLPQVPQNGPRQKVSKKRSRQQVDKGTTAKKVAKPETMPEDKGMLELKIQLQDAVIEAQKVMLQVMMSQIIKRKMAEAQGQAEGGNPDYELIRSVGCGFKKVMDMAPESFRVAMEARFSSQYEELKSQFVNHIDASEWEKIGTVLHGTWHPERTQPDNIQCQSDVPAAALPPGP